MCNNLKPSIKIASCFQLLKKSASTIFVRIQNSHDNIRKSLFKCKINKIKYNPLSKWSKDEETSFGDATTRKEVYEGPVKIK